MFDPPKLDKLFSRNVDTRLKSINSIVKWVTGEIGIPHKEWAKDPKIIDALLKSVDDRDAKVREKAIRALAVFCRRFSGGDKRILDKRIRDKFLEIFDDCPDRSKLHIMDCIHLFGTVACWEKIHAGLNCKPQKNAVLYAVRALNSSRAPLRSSKIARKLLERLTPLIEAGPQTPGYLNSLEVLKECL